jgi:hypothetical protein
MMIIPETDPAWMVWRLVLNAILAAESFSGWTIAGFLFFTLSLEKSIISTINRTMATTMAIQAQVDIFNLPDFF